MADEARIVWDAERRQGFDPYIVWVLGRGRRYYFLPGRQNAGEERMPLLARLQKDQSVAAFAAGSHIKNVGSRSAWQEAVQVSSLHTEAPTRAGSRPFFTATMLADYATSLFTDVSNQHVLEDTRKVVESVTLGRPFDSATLPPPCTASATAKKPQAATQGGVAANVTLPPAVVMGIVDDGIAFAHERFRKIVNGTVETRIEYCWLQDCLWAPSTFTLLPGRELDRLEINALLQNNAYAGAVDEDLLYRKAGLIDFRLYGHKSAAWRISHGTHVMDLAAGFDPLPPRGDRPIICVQLPVRVTADTSGGNLFPAVSEAMKYIVSQAKVIAPHWGVTYLPIVINVSYGVLAGPHDGTSEIEAFIDDLISQYETETQGVPLRVVLPAGNSYLSRTHAQTSFQLSAEFKELYWRVLPDDRTPSFLEIWLPEPAIGAPSSRITVTITSPTKQVFTIDENATLVPLGSYGEASYNISTSNRRWFVIALAATTDLDPAVPLAPAGTWTIKLEHTGGLSSTDLVHAWVQRDDSLYGYPLRGRQSHFDDEEYDRHDHAGRDEEVDNNVSLVRRESTINAMATGEASIVMGGYLKKERVAAKYSAAGAKTPPPRWPDAMAVSEDSRVHTGVLAAGSHSGSVVAMGGTSVAAPQIARFVAGELAASKAGNRAAVQARATNDDPGYVANERGGYGRIKLDPIVKTRRYE